MIRTQLFRFFQRKISSGQSDDFTPGCLEELDQEKTQKSASDDGDGHPFEYVRSFENIHGAAERFSRKRMVCQKVGKRNYIFFAEKIVGRKRMVGKTGDPFPQFKSFYSFPDRDRKSTRLNSSHVAISY